MLTSLRKHTGGIIAKLLLGFLSLSFVVWGISDVFRGFTGDSSVAVVGGEKITATAFRQSYDNNIRNYSQQFGQQISPDMARRMGLPRTTLNGMVDAAAMRAETRKLGLGISRDELVRRIRADQRFAGLGGAFDATTFAGILAQSNLNEALYVSLRREEELNNQLTASVAGGDTAPGIYKKALGEFFGQERAIRYIVLPASLAGEVAPPTDEELTKFFNDNKSAWSAPEYRSLVVVKLDSSDVAKPAEVTDAEVRAAFDRQKAQLSTPERRDVQQIVFKTPEEANAALEKLKGGMTFDALITDLKLNASDVNLGSVTKTAIFDPAVRDVVFSLPTDGTSDIIKGRFGQVIVHVGTIQPGTEVKFEDVADKIRNDIAKDKANPRLTAISDEIEDARSGGASLADAAQKAGLTPIVIAAVSRDGKAPDGSSVTVPGDAQVLSEAFDSDVGVENNPLPFGDRGAVWFDVTKVEKARERTLDEVRDQVVTRWTNEKKQQKVLDIAGTVLERVRKGEDMAAIAKEGNWTLSEAPKLTRVETPADDLTGAVVSAAFSGAEGYSAIAAGKDGAQVVLRVDKVSTPDNAPDLPQVSQTLTQLSQALSSDISQAYVEAVKAGVGVSIDDAAVQSAINGTSDGSAPTGPSGPGPLGF